IAVNGVVTSSKLFHRDVTMRPLSPYERGALAEAAGSQLAPSLVPNSDLVIPQSMSREVPASLIEVSTVRPKSDDWDTSTLHHSVALSFFLHDYELSSTGVAVGFDRPHWTTSGRSHQPFAVNKKITGAPVTVDQQAFESVVDLAY